ncbi:MAG: DUF6036 family nucleotidyltransferase [Chthonomonadales bacterium]
MTQFQELLGLLNEHEVEFIVIGGIAAAVHGSARLTSDVDIFYKRTKENAARIVNALENTKPYLRGAPEGLPFIFDGDTIWRGLNFTFVTTLGDIDIMGEVAGLGSFEEAERHSVWVDPFGVRCRCIDLEYLIIAKRAAGRPKDFETIAELESIMDMQSDSL